MKVSRAEVEWVTRHADVASTGTLHRDELFACVAHWYMHVPPLTVSHKHGLFAALPWLLARRPPPFFHLMRILMRQATHVSYQDCRILCSSS